MPLLFEWTSMPDQTKKRAGDLSSHGMPVIPLFNLVRHRSPVGIGSIEREGVKIGIKRFIEFLGVY